MDKHFGNGPPPGEMALYNTAGQLVANFGRQTGGTYSLTFFDTSGTAVAIVGQTSDGHTGTVQYDSNGVELLRSDERGLISPPLAVGMAGGTGTTSTVTPDAIDISSGSFNIIYVGSVPAFVHQGLQLVAGFVTPGGTTGEAEVIIRQIGGPALATSTVYSIGSGVSVAPTLSWLHGVSLPGPASHVELQVRRTGGAGSVTVVRPYGIYFVGPTGMTGGGGVWA